LLILYQCSGGVWKKKPYGYTKHAMSKQHDVTVNNHEITSQLPSTSSEIQQQDSKTIKIPIPTKYTKLTDTFFRGTGNGGEA